MSKECASCCCKVPKLYKVRRNYPTAEIEICDVCYRTQCGNLGLYPNNVIDERIILLAIAQCTNMILAEIRKN